MSFANSALKAQTLGIASFFLRWACQNRNLWCVEEWQEVLIPYWKLCPARFVHEVAPALDRFAGLSPAPFVDGIRAVREEIVARSDGNLQDILRKRGLSRAEDWWIVETRRAEE